MPLRSARSFLGILLSLTLGSGCMSWMRRTPVPTVPCDQVAHRTSSATDHSPYAEVKLAGPRAVSKSGDPDPSQAAASDLQQAKGHVEKPALPPAALPLKEKNEGGQEPESPPKSPEPPRLFPQPAAPPVEPVVAALECILRSRHQEALAHLKKYDGPTQELFLRLLPAVALMTQKGLAGLNAREVGLLNEQLHGLLVSLRPRTELGIDQACFCSWVKSYGVYKPLPEGHGFVPSSPTSPGELVQLYVELRNFVSELRGDHFETRLSSTVEIADGNGRRIWFYGFDDGKTPIRSRTMLHDWFSNYTFYAPHLPPGTYRLTITVTDETRPEQRRSARRSLEFRVAAVAARIP